MRRYLFLSLCLGLSFVSPAQAEPPPLLVKAVDLWAQGRQELAFTQRTRALNEDGTSYYERVERYDPSLSDDQRWKLLEVNGRPPTEKERQDIEVKRNRKPRKRTGNAPASYLDLEQAKLLRETAESAVFQVSLKPDAAKFVSLDKLVLEVAVNKTTGAIENIGASLREPMRVAFGLAKVIDVDMDVQFIEPDSGPPPASAVAAESTARAVVRKFGEPLEFSWSDFKEVRLHGSPAK